MASKQWIVEGNAWKVGSNVNTESITPSTWLHAGHDLLMQHIGEILIPDFPQKVKQDDIFIAGSNLGCSSSRNAPLFLKDKGIGAIVCHSAARIFYRSALGSGIPIFEIGNDVDKINMGDRLRINVETGEINNLTTSEQMKAKQFPDFIMEILEAGGINQKIAKNKSKYPLLK